jgi:hypothetical protein
MYCTWLPINHEVCLVSSNPLYYPITVESDIPEKGSGSCVQLYKRTVLTQYIVKNGRTCDVSGDDCERFRELLWKTRNEGYGLRSCGSGVGSGG